MLSRSPESSVYHVSILGEGNAPLCEGSLEATPTTLVYTDDSSPTRYSWLIQQLHRFDLKGEDQFVIEGGKQCSSNRGAYTFATPNARQIHAVVSRNANLLTQTMPLDTPTLKNRMLSETSPVHWRLNTSTSSDSSNQSPVHSRSASLVKEGVFEVERIFPDPRRGTELGTLEVSSGCVLYADPSGLVLSWPIEFLRRYGYEGDLFTVETGRRCSGGAGFYKFKTPKAQEINTAVKLLGAGNLRDRHSTSTSPPSTPPVSTIPVRRGPLPVPPSPSSSSSPHGSQPPSSVPHPRSTPPAQQRHVPPSLPSPHHHLHRTPQQLGTTAPFKRSDSLIRRAFSAMDLRQNVFEVRNISDEHKEVGQGTVEVTGTDLIYIDSSTNEKWKWPYKFLRKYGYEGNIFTFEAGRRCPGGEGLYAFASERANEIHETIVESIRSHKQSVAQSDKFARSANRNPRLSLTSEQMTTPPIQMSNRSRYDVNTSPSATRKGGTPVALVPILKTPPITTPTDSGATPTSASIAHTRSHRSMSTPLVEGLHSGPDHAHVLSHSAHFPKTATPTTSSSADDNKFPLVKPVMEPVKPVQREDHLYDVVGRNAQKGVAIASDTPTRRNADLASSMSSSTDLSRQSPEVNKVFANGYPKNPSFLNSGEGGESAIQRGSGSRGGASSKRHSNKPSMPSVLSRIIGKRSHNGSTSTDEGQRSPAAKQKSKKKKWKKSGKGSSEAVEPQLRRLSYGVDDDEAGSNSMYQNLEVAQLRKMTYSASCDNILAAVRSQSNASSSSVPQPSLDSGGRKNPSPTGTASSASTATPTLSMYQNLADVLPEVAAAMQQPHDTTFDGTDTHPPESATPPVYSNINISDRPELVPMLGPKPKQPSYAVVDIVRLPPSAVNNKPTKPRILKQTSLNMIPDMELKSSPKSSSSVSNRQRSLSTFNDVSDSGSSHQDVFAEESDSRNKGVVYASLDMVAMSAVEHIREEHKDVRNFEDLLQRHDLREEEMNRRRGKVSTSHDQ